MDAYINETAAVAHSIQHSECAYVALPEDISGRDDREQVVLENLVPFNTEDYVRENDGSLHIWGTDDAGNEWSVRTVDGLTQSVRYLR